MHPKALLDACTELTRLLLRFEHPADSMVSKYFRDQRKTMDLGPRERSVLAETVYNVLRQNYASSIWPNPAPVCASGV